MKKLLLGLGAIASVAAPVAAVVACGSTSESFADKRNDEIKKITASDLAAADKEEMILAVQATKTQAELDKVVAGYADELKAATMKDGDAEKKVMLTDDIKEMADYKELNAEGKADFEKAYGSMTLVQLRTAVDHWRETLLQEFQDELGDFLDANATDDAIKTALKTSISKATNWESLMRNIANEENMAKIIDAEQLAKTLAAAKASALATTPVLASGKSITEFETGVTNWEAQASKNTAKWILGLDTKALTDPVWDESVSAVSFDPSTGILSFTGDVSGAKTFKIINK